MDDRYIVLSALAVWRISHLISLEDGPFDIVYRLRRRLGPGFWGKLMDCFYCSSVWVALPFGCWLGRDWKERLLTWVALSGAACLAEQLTAKKEKAPVETNYFKED